MKAPAGRNTLADRLDRVIRGCHTAGRQTVSRAGTTSASDEVEAEQTEEILAMASHWNGTSSASPSASLVTGADSSSKTVAPATEPTDLTPGPGGGSLNREAAPEETSARAGERSKPPIRVLVAEADSLHRQVLVALVTNLGYVVDATASAEEAVAAFQRHPYGLVMLDCDSSETRGLETAATLRRLEGAAERTPILAITGDGGQEHRKQRKAAGIDNYIAKPILRENVVSVLTRYARPETVGEPPRYLALDRHRLQELDEAAGDRPELLQEWLGLFLAGSPVLLDRMRGAAEDGDATALFAAAHSLRSRSGQIGALRVQEICGTIAALAGSGSLAGVESLLPEVSLALERAMRELRLLENETRGGRRLAAGESGGLACSRNGASANSTDTLLAEADPLIARFLVNSLSTAGFQVTHVAGGNAALDAVRAQDFGVVILDLDVPEVDGFSVLSEIRMQPRGGTPVMIVSSHHQEQDILRAFELGADDYVTIPFSPMEVVARVRRLIKQGAHVS